MRNIILFLLLFFIANAVTGQNRTFKVRADKAYADKDYITAAYYYDKALQNGTITSQGTVPYFSTRQDKEQHEKEFGDIAWHLAESYRLYQNLTQAETAYKQVMDDYELYYPLSRYWYTVCLLANNHIDEAISNIKAFIINNKNNKEDVDLGNRELNNCLFAKDQLKSQTTAKATKLGGHLNGDGGDFALVTNNDKFWFNSSRSEHGIKGHLNQLFFSGKDSASAKTKLSFGQAPKADMQYGTPSLNASGNRMYLTVWYKEKGNTVSAIYLSRLNGQHWSVPQLLNRFVNFPGYNSMQPCVTPDGRHLYFSSNQPCGFGGMDIWVSDLDYDGLPINAENLGFNVNTPDDEEAPYYSEPDKRLVFASKGFVGMGGFDLFESTNTGQVWSWTTPQNLGYPFNSIKDDIYYYPDDKDENLAYISSDRESECCLNLFKVKFVKPKVIPPPSAVLTGWVINCATGLALPGVSINLLDSVSKQVSNATTDQTGKYQFRLVVKHAYSLRLEKTGYFAKVLHVSSSTVTKTDTLFNPVVCQQEYEINKPIVIDNILYAFNKSTLTPESKIVLNGLITILQDNPKIKVELSSHTDSYGPDWSNNRLSQDRAQACVNYIISRGIAHNRIIAKGYGKTMPIAPNTLPDGSDNPAGRKLNRRTEFKVLSND